MRFITASLVVALLAMTAILLVPRIADAHCDTMDGPVAQAGVRALESGNLIPVLRWVGDQQEQELQDAFAKARSLRSGSNDIRDVVDMYFLETLVRLHRATEGQPYAGLKPAGTDLGPAIQAAEHALATGSGEELVDSLSHQLRAGVESRLTRALDARRHADESVEQGRAWVAAYVDLMHYVEAVDAAVVDVGEHRHDDPHWRDHDADRPDR